MCPRQLSHHWRDFFISLAGFVKLPHAEQVRSGEAFQTGLGVRDVGGELLHHPVPPIGAGDLGADAGSHLSVKIDKGCIRRLEGLLPGCPDHAYLVKGEAGGLFVIDFDTGSPLGCCRR
jgi:hypothetical protein